MPAKHVSVVGGEEDDCVVENAFLAQRAEDQADGVIDVSAQRIEASQAGLDGGFTANVPALTLCAKAEAGAVEILAARG